MKAAVYRETGPPGVLKYEDVPDPVCFPHGVVIDVEAISIEGGDTLNRAGGAMTATPHIVGYQCAGTISEIGEKVRDREVGQQVVATMLAGSHAEKVAVPAQFTWPIPTGGDVMKCACVPIAYGTAHECLFEFGRLVEGESVLIQAAAGGLGIAGIQLAKRAGATVYATASSDERLEKVAHLGIDHPVNYSRPNWVGEVRGLTGGVGVNLAVDSVGGSILEGSIKCLGRRGRAITVGSAGRNPRPLDVSLLSLGNTSLTGVFLGGEMTDPRIHDLIGNLVGEVAAGSLDVLVDRTYPLAEAAAAHERIENREAIGRVVLLP